MSCAFVFRTQATSITGKINFKVILLIKLMVLYLKTINLYAPIYTKAALVERNRELKEGRCKFAYTKSDRDVKSGDHRRYG